MDIQIYKNRSQLGTVEITNINQFHNLITDYAHELDIEFISANTGEILFISNTLYIEKPDFTWAKVWEEVSIVDADGHETYCSKKVWEFTPNWSDAYETYENLCQTNAKETMFSMCDFKIDTINEVPGYKSIRYIVFEYDGSVTTKTVHINYVDRREF